MNTLLDEIKNIDSSKKELRKFGLTIGVVLLSIGLALFIYMKATYIYFISTGFLSAALGLAVPKLLFPFQKAWMTFAVVLGFVSTRVILFVLFYLIITPTKLFSKLFGKEFLSLNINKQKKSYWNYRKESEYKKIDTERQF